MLAAPVENVAFAGRRACVQLDSGDWDLAFFAMRKAEGGGPGY
jgi:hypothetical protein